MTQEEKAKAYDEAVKRAKSLYGENTIDSDRSKVCAIIFPELAESKDERIRKEMIEYFHGCIQRNKKSGFRVEQIKGWIAYLEKLKEFQFNYPGIYFYDGEKLHFQGNPVMEEKQKEPNPSTPIEQEPTEKQDYSGLTELERAIHRGFLCAGVENVPVEIIKETAQECRLVQMKPVEWSEEDEAMLNAIIKRYGFAVVSDCAVFIKTEGLTQMEKELDWLNSLRHQLHWKPGKKQMEALDKAIEESVGEDYHEGLVSLDLQLKKL